MREKEKVDAKVVPKEMKLKSRERDEEAEITKRVTRVYETLNKVSKESEEKPVFWEFLHVHDSIFVLTKIRTLNPSQGQLRTCSILLF